MRLGINGWRIHGQRTGIGRYLFNVVKHWTPEVVADRFDEIVFYTPKPLDRSKISLPENIRERVLGPEWRMLVWESVRMGPVATEDVTFHPSYSRPLLARGKTVVVTHDATSALYPDLFSKSIRRYNRLYGWSARHATEVITTSEAARADISKAWNVRPSKIRITRLAPDEIFRPVEDHVRLREVSGRLFGIEGRFFLFVGKLSGRRNVPVLVEAFANAKREGGLPHKLVLVGPDEGLRDLEVLAVRLGVGEDVVRGPYVSDEDLNLLYNAAEAFVMPSIYETSSLPVMEAQAVGTPVVCVDTPGSRETTGGAALLIPRLAVPELSEALRRIAEDEDLRRRLGAEGKAHMEKYSWLRCARETIEVLASVASERA